MAFLIFLTLIFVAIVHLYTYLTLIDNLKTDMTCYKERCEEYLGYIRDAHKVLNELEAPIPISNNFEIGPAVSERIMLLYLYNALPHGHTKHSEAWTYTQAKAMFEQHKTGQCGYRGLNCIYCQIEEGTWKLIYNI